MPHTVSAMEYAGNRLKIHNAPKEPTLFRTTIFCNFLTKLQTAHPS